MNSGRFDFALRGVVGQGVAVPGDFLARIYASRLHLFVSNPYPLIIREGHNCLTVRLSNRQIHNRGDKLDDYAQFEENEV